MTEAAGQKIFLTLALRSLSRHRVRALLAIIGIIIGVLAIASLGILGSSLTTLVTGLVSDVTDTIVVTPHLAASTGDPMDPRNMVAASISERDLDRIRRVIGTNRAIPMTQGADRIEVGDKAGYASVIALHSEDIPFLIDLSDGVYPKGTGSGCVVGARLAEEYDAKAGGRIRIGDEDVRIVGIAAERGMAIDINPDYAVIVSSTWYSEYYDEEDYSQVIVKVKDLDEIPEVKDAIDLQMNRREVKMDVQDSREMLELVYQSYDAISFFLVGIGAVALLVSGVSILNVMIISVTERTKEIGVMRSIGTMRREILLMFVYEALVMGLIGSVIGGVLSIIAGYLITASVAETLFSTMTSAVQVPLVSMTTLRYVLFSMFFGTVVCVLSGIYPAWKAANLNPVEALHYE